MSIIKRLSIVFFCVVVVGISFVFPASAQSVDNTFYFNIPNPAENFDGYVVLPFAYSSSNTRAECIFWTIDCINDSSAQIDNPQLNVSVDVTKTKFTLSFENMFGTDANTLVYAVTIYTLFDGDSTPIQRVNCELVDYNSPYTYVINFPTSSYPNGSLLTPYHFKGISLNSTSSTNAYTYDCVYSDNNPQLNELIKINEHFVSMLQKQDYTNEQLSTLLDKFQWLLESVYNIEWMFDEFVHYYWQNFVDSTFPDGIFAISSRLDKIYHLLNKEGEVEQTTVDSSKVDDYFDIEQSLLDNDNADDAIGGMDISIDGESYSFIWNLITDFFSTHPAVIALAITLLTLGFIALLLNR